MVHLETANLIIQCVVVVMDQCNKEMFLKGFFLEIYESKE